MGVHLHDFPLGWRPAASNGPAGLVGDRRRRPVRAFGHAPAQLARHDLECPARFTLGFGLTNTDDGRKAGAPCRSRFQRNVRHVRLRGPQLAPLGMADNHIVRAGVFQHLRADIAREGARGLGAGNL